MPRPIPLSLNLMLGPQIAADLIAQCRVAAGEIGQAFSRAFDYTVEATLGAEPESLNFAEMEEELNQPGLVVLLHVGAAAAVMIVPAARGIMPAWYDAPDRIAQSKLTTLAQELGMLVLPEAFMAEDCQAARVDRLSQALDEGGAADGASMVRLTLQSGDRKSAAIIVWPLASPHSISKIIAPAAATTATPGVAPATATDGETDSASEASDVESRSRKRHAGEGSALSAAAKGAAPETPTAASSSSPTKSGSASKSGPRGPSFRDLPIYTRSLLKIRVPLSVSLASKKQPVGQILEIGLGSIIQFEKSCEEMLDLNVNNLPIARGEAVKVGEKFGLRVTSLILPGERFKPVQPGSERVKSRK